MQHPREFREPGAQAVGNAISDPEPDFCFGLDAVLPAIRFFKANAENARDRFAAHSGAKLLGVLPVRPRWYQAATRLPVGDEGWRKLTNALHVQRTGRSAARVWN